MELATVPHRPPAGEWRRLALALVVLVPVALLVLLPAGMGLDRYVVTDGTMGGTLGKGSVVLDRDVPAGDLKVGDTITFARPGDAGDHPVTRRIVAIDDGVMTTRGDGTAVTDPWRLRLDHATYPRVILHLPWVGYPFLVPGAWLALFAVLAGAVLLAAWHLHRRGPRPERSALGGPAPRAGVGGTVRVG